MKDFLEQEVDRIAKIVDGCAAQYNVAVGQLQQAKNTLEAFLNPPKKDEKQPTEDPKKAKK